eukprot:13797923-Alexandrium_andersonii.AAC.1
MDPQLAQIHVAPMTLRSWSFLPASRCFLWKSSAFLLILSSSSASSPLRWVVLSHFNDAIVLAWAPHLQHLQ